MQSIANATPYRTAIISNSVFENNVGAEHNYTVDNNYGTIYLYNNTINTQSAEIHNYGGNISSPCTAIALENKTIPVFYETKSHIIENALHFHDMAFCNTLLISTECFGKHFKIGFHDG